MISGILLHPWTGSNDFVTIFPNKFSTKKESENSEPSLTQTEQAHNLRNKTCFTSTDMCKTNFKCFNSITDLD